MDTTMDSIRPIYIEKVQMGSERQCGLGSLLPMSCRGRAEAFARRLHTRLRRLGTEPGGAAHEATWLTSPPPQPHADSDVYFDFDAEPESPSSPVDDVVENGIANAPPPSNHRADPESGCVFSSPVDVESPPSNSDSDAAYFDLDADSEHAKSHMKIRTDEQPTLKTKPVLTKLKLSAPTPGIIDQLFQNKSISPERQSPIRTQPLARENGFADYGSLERRDSSNTLYSPINFDDCKKRNSHDRYNSGVDEVDNVVAESYCNGRLSPERSHDILINGEAHFKQNSIEVVEEQPELEIEAESPPETIVEESKEVVEEEPVACAEDQTEHDSSDDRPQRVRRCSSLRSGKTPPGTPGRKKIVRFADVLGLDLADVKTFMDDIPYVPKSAYEDLRDADLSSLSIESIASNDSAQAPDKCLIGLFQQPGDQPNFLDILNTRSVCLENAVIQEGATIAIYGTVKVRNLDFHKSVQIRYSLDSWKTFSDLQATYVPNSCDGFSDRFQFLLYAHTLTAGQKLEFAVRFMCKGCQFWDNNLGTNYCFQCISSNNASSSTFYIPSTMTPVDTWHPSFY